MVHPHEGSEMLEVAVIIGACISAAIIFYSFVTRSDPPKLYGRYSLPGKWFYLKYYFAFIYLKLRMLGALKFDQRAGYGKKSRDLEPEEMDIPQPLSDHELAVDATYFNGYNRDGVYIGTGIQRRPKQMVETLLYIRVPDLGILEWPFHPATAAKATDSNGFETNGLRYESVVPMKHWKLTFTGDLRLKGHFGNAQTPKLVGVEFDLDWLAQTDYFDYDTDMSAAAIADAMAREPWSRAFFQRLHRAHQTHTEQYGLLKGTLRIAGHGSQMLEMYSMHDHSYGTYRDWGAFNRYLLHYFAAEDGTRLSFLMISITDTLTHLAAGFVFDPSGAKLSIDRCDKTLWDIGGENGAPLASHSIRLWTGSRTFELKVEAIDETSCYCGWNWEARITAKFCRATINSVTAYGMCELEYRNVGGPKPEVS